MKNSSRFKVFSFFLITAYLLAACGGTLPQTTTSLKGPKVDANVVAFTGIVEAINGTEWTVSGQKFTLDPQASLDPNIAVGDEVKVEGNVSADGIVTALKVESSASDDAISTPSVDASASGTPEPGGTSSPDESTTPKADSSPDAPGQIAGANENEVFGTVDAITASAITVNGVTYNLTNFTEIKDVLTAGDPVKLHVILNADGTVTVREVEKSIVSFDDNSGNSDGSDDGPDHDANDDNPNGNSSDDGPDHDNDDDHGGNSGSGGGDSDDD